MLHRIHKIVTIADHALLARSLCAGNNVLSNLLKRDTPCSTNSHVLYQKNNSYNVQKITNYVQNHTKVSSRSFCTKPLNTENEELDSDKESDIEESLSLSENGTAYKIVQSKCDSKNFGVYLQPSVELSSEELESILTKEWIESTTDEILNTFEKLCRTHATRGFDKLEILKYTRIMNALTNKLRELSDKNLEKAFQSLLCIRQLIRKDNVPLMNMSMELERECLRRISKWSHDEIFLICDYLYKLGIIQVSKFTMKALTKLGYSPKQLSPKQLLHFLFLINCYRKPAINMYEVEYQIDCVLDKFTGNELGVIAMGFFKSQTPIRDQDLIAKMHAILIRDIDTMADVCVSGIMKITRYSTGLKHMALYKKTLGVLTKKLPQFSIPCVIHILHAAAYVQLYDEGLMNAGMQRIMEGIDKARIKDIERLAWVLHIFNFNPKLPIFDRICQVLDDPKREREFKEFPRILPSLLSWLSYLTIFPIDRIKQVFREEFFEKTYGNKPFRISFCFFTLECNVKIDLPEYDGPFLRESVREQLAKYVADSSKNTDKKIRAADQFTNDVVHHCKTVLKSSRAVLVDRVLPQYSKPDVILCFDKDNNALDPSITLSSMPPGTIKYIPPSEKNLKWIAIVLATQNQMIDSNNDYVGALICKVRQLKKLGYYPIVINIYPWRNMSVLEQEKYIDRQINLAHDQISAIAKSEGL